MLCSNFFVNMLVDPRYLLTTDSLSFYLLRIARLHGRHELSAYVES